MKIAIAGYGNLGRAAAKAVNEENDLKLVGVFSRRDVKTLTTPENVKLYPFDLIEEFKSDVDVVLNCMGSANDLPKTTPYLASLFNTVDAFDTHAKIPEHFENVQRAASAAGKTALLCVGWDPGLFSLARLYMTSVMPGAKSYTFWGTGVSQGHTDALKGIDGVLFARQYTVPLSGAVEKVKSGEMPPDGSERLHRRVCYIVSKEGADKKKIEDEIKNMPGYFKGYQTEVNFITLEDFLKEHKSMAHAGSVIACRKGESGVDTLEFSLSASSNPALTASILVAFARACFKMAERGETGAKTVFDVRPSDLFEAQNADERDLFSLL